MNREKQALTIAETLRWLPISGIQHCAFSGTLDDFLECNGGAISRSTYSSLFSLVGTAFGAGDGSTTFNLPDFRGRFLVGAGLSFSRGSASATSQTKNTSLTTSSIATHSHSGTTPVPGVPGYYYEAYRIVATGAHSHSISSGGDTVTMPIYQAVNWAIKYTSSANVPSVPLNLNKTSNFYGDKISASVGVICAMAAASAPSGWIFCNGQSLSRTTYAELFSAIGTTWGSISGSEFTLPDFRDRFVLQNTPGLQQVEQTGTPKINITLAHAAHNHTFSNPVLWQTNGSESWYYLSETTEQTSTHTHSHSTATGGDSETRPKNVYVKYVIRVR